MESNFCCIPVCSGPDLRSKFILEFSFKQTNVCLSLFFLICFLQVLPLQIWVKVIGSGVSHSEFRAWCQFLCLKPSVAPYCLRIKCKPFTWSATHALASEVKSKAIICRSCVCHSLVPFWAFAYSGTEFVEWIMLSELRLFQFYRAVIVGISGNRQVGPAKGGLTLSRAAYLWSRLGLSCSWRLRTPLLSRLFCPQECFPLSVKSYLCGVLSLVCFWSPCVFPIMSPNTKRYIILYLSGSSRRHRTHPFRSPL